MLKLISGEVRGERAQANMGKWAGNTIGFLGHLRKDARGNVLAIVGAATLPLLAVMGSGIDIGRAYLVKSRLQQACDAGVLAGRRAMSAGGTVTTAVTNETQKFVNFNFPQNYNQTSGFLIQPTLGANDQLNLSLSTSMDTAVMKAFGRPSIGIAVSCTGRNDYANIDVVLVLDTTGSMACSPTRSSTDCSNWINDNDRSGKTMTIGGRTVTYVREEGLNSSLAGTNISRMESLRTALSSLKTQLDIIENQFNTAAAGSRKRIRYAIVPFSQMVNAGFSRGEVGTTLYARNPTWFNTSANYRNGSNTSTVSHTSTWINNTWDGCVEEQSTSNAITPTSGHQIPNNLPLTAFDLMFDTLPSSAATRWTMADDAATGSAQYACPKAMRELQPMTTTNFNSYFSLSEGFIANGGTYLDIGLLWAARLLSRTGLWASDNPQFHNSFPVARYVIFMTDGVMDTGNSGYGAYAQESFWRRVASTGTVTASNANHTQRWLMTCSAIKNMDVKIFSISFGAGSTLSNDLQSCSSGAGYGFKADNTAQLTQAFRDIGDNIGSLRLSQ